MKVYKKFTEETPKKKALKILRNRCRMVDPPSDAETIPYVHPPSEAETILYAEPYKNIFSKRDNIYRKKAKKNALKIITRARMSRAAKEKRKSLEELADLERQALEYLQQNPIYERPTFSKKDDIYRKNAKKML